jgi:curli biogenesis system outer membrane secretion channel CsgG
LQRRVIVIGTVLAVLAAAVVPLNAGAANGPTVAVLDFSTKGLTSDWWGQWQPGVALSDLVTDHLVNGGKFDVLDRKNIDTTLSEHKLAASGEVDPTTAISAGRLVGARYLIQGNILQFDRTGRSGGGAGSLLPGALGGIVGGIRQDRVTLKVAVKVVDARTGRIVQSFSDEVTNSATSISGGAFSGYTAGGYSNSNFVNSTMGHLINDEAIKIAAQLDPAKFGTSAPAVVVSGRVIDVDGSSVIINAGSSKGVTVGMYFDVVKVKQIKDPDSGRMLSVSQTVGTIQVMTVNADSAVARRVTGTVAVGNTVQSQ